MHNPSKFCIFYSTSEARHSKSIPFFGFSLTPIHPPFISSSALPSLAESLLLHFSLIFERAAHKPICQLCRILSDNIRYCRFFLSGTSRNFLKFLIPYLHLTPLSFHIMRTLSVLCKIHTPYPIQSHGRALYVRQTSTTHYFSRPSKCPSMPPSIRPSTHS